MSALEENEILEVLFDLEYNEFSVRGYLVALASCLPNIKGLQQIDLTPGVRPIQNI